jgi:hypothetical protein
MSTITVELPDEDLAFSRAYSAERGISPEAFLAHQARNLREYLQRPLHPDVAAAIGIVPPSVEAEKEYHEYIERKHR